MQLARCQSTQTDLQDWAVFADCHWELPLVSIALYLVFVAYAPARMWLPRWLLIAWNMFLAFGSAVGFGICLPTLLHIVQRGRWYAVCSGPEAYQCGWVGTAIAAFTVSKILELGDTVFLRWRNRPVIFLHWYHHATVLLFCWHAFAVRTGVAGLWFATVNMGIHALMYSYYACMAACAHCGLRKVAPLLTAMQIAQMFVGASILALGRFLQGRGLPCSLPASVVASGGAMYVTYAALFGLFFYRAYCVPKKPKRA